MQRLLDSALRSCPIQLLRAACAFIILLGFFPPFVSSQDEGMAKVSIELSKSSGGTAIS